jgi:hypothetical protein
MRVCKKCGREFHVKYERQQYCDIHCSNSAKAARFKNGVVIACDECGGRNYLSLSQYRLKAEHPHYRRVCPACEMKRHPGYAWLRVERNTR